MFSFALEGMWLGGGLGAVYLLGVFTSQWAKDKLKGIPSDLRAALKTAEAAALSKLTAAKASAVADTAALLTGAPAPAPAPAPVVAAPATVAAPVAVPAAP